MIVVTFGREPRRPPGHALNSGHRDQTAGRAPPRPTREGGRKTAAPHIRSAASALGRRGPGIATRTAVPTTADNDPMTNWTGRGLGPAAA